MSSGRAWRVDLRQLDIPDNNKLEFIWTAIPAVVLLVLVFTGLKEWNKITDSQNQTDGLKIQIYGKQFDWTARYSGADNKLGSSSFLKINDSNPLGVDSADKAAADTNSQNYSVVFNMPNSYSQQVPLKAAALNLKAVLFMDVAKYVKAKEYLQQALAIFPNFEGAKQNAVNCDKSLKELKTKD